MALSKILELLFHVESLSRPLWLCMKTRLFAWSSNSGLTPAPGGLGARRPGPGPGVPYPRGPGLGVPQISRGIEGYYKISIHFKIVGIQRKL